MFQRQGVVQRFFTCVCVCVCLLTLISQGTMAHAASRATSSANSVISSCVAPPASFNPLTATQSEVTLYGLPPKPTNKQDLQRWARQVSAAKRRVCGTSIARPNLYSRSLPTRASGAAARPNFSNASWYTWSGYATGWGYGSGFDEAYGEWVLPCVTAPDSWGYHSITWVGIGGWYNNEYLLQAGSINDPTWGLSLWWEAWPNNAIQVVPGISPKCNDEILGDVWVNYSTSTSYYYVDDVTQGVYYEGQYNNFVPDRQSSEWIDERPTCANGNHTPLANFGSTLFTDAYTQVVGTSNYGSISAYRAGAITMVSSSGATLAAPGGLNSAGDSFRDYWYGTGSGSLC